MPRNTLQFCIPIIVAVLSCEVFAAAPIIRAQKSTVEIEYETNATALPLERVELWYTRDDGRTWTFHGTDEDRHSPVVFRAAEEGQFGFFVVLTNATGSSSGRPVASTRPQISVFVDFTPPVVQIHPARMTPSAEARVVQVRWTAIDAHLEPRPISIHYKFESGSDWRAIHTEPLANTGLYDWRISDDMMGPVRLRVSAVDRGGNQSHSEEQPFEIPSAMPLSTTVGTSEFFSGFLPDDDATLSGSQRARKRVAALVTQAREHDERGELVEGIARLRDAVRLDPTATEAFTEMGRMLLAVGDSERALDAFQIALKQRPKDRAALLGAALAQRDQRNYPAAAEHLRTILRYRPDDAEIWLALGDVAVFQGDELLARECYLRASRIDPEATAVIADARQRLALMSSFGRSDLDRPVRKPLSASDRLSGRP